MEEHNIVFGRWKKTREEKSGGIKKHTALIQDVYLIYA